MTLDEPLPPLAVLRLAGRPAYHGLIDDAARRAAVVQLFRDKGYRQEAFPVNTWRQLLTTMLRCSVAEVPLAAEPHRLVRRYVAGEADDGWLRTARIVGASQREPDFVGDEAAVTTEGLGTLSDYGLTRSLEDVPIAIIGFGAAGIIMTATLQRLGFKNLTVYEHRPEVAGIWSRSSVYSGSRNNPRRLLLNSLQLGAAPGDGTSVKKVLYDLTVGLRARFLNELVTRVVPGHHDHAVHTVSGEIERFPIVINAIGLGNPRAITDPSKMVGPADHVRASRWQDPAFTYLKKNDRVLLVGLGNSTAEMLRIFQQVGQENYRVLTHYPRDAVMNPNETVVKEGRMFRMFRDLRKPDLTAFQGDLDHSRDAYYRALLDGKIISDVRQWDVTGAASPTEDSAARKKLGLMRHGDRRVQDAWEFDHLFVLTGYQHGREVYKKMGIPTRQSGGRVVPVFDYDGEFTGGSPVSRGYFGLGAVLDAPGNRNAVVIPGMLYRLPELVFGVIARAGAWRLQADLATDRLKEKILSRWRGPDGFTVSLTITPKVVDKQRISNGRMPELPKKTAPPVAVRPVRQRIRNERGQFA